MNDFTRSVDMDTPGTPAFLNGDMKPRWALSQRLPPPKDIPNTTADDIDIEEDGFIGIEEIEVDEARQQLGPEEAKLLWMPLPLDLPIFEKDIITQMAAYEGNVDRYVRLMHPRRLRTDYEFYSILRGIYHNTMFARWWADQLETHPERVIRPGSTPADDNKRDCDLIRTAINARRIMTNDISGLTDDPNCRPWLIWWPLLPHHNTLSALAEKCPSMRPQIAIACILSNDQVLYERLNLRPRESLLQVARRSENPFYLEDLNKRAAEQGLEFEYLGPKEEIGRSLELNLEPSIDVVFDRIQRGDMDDDYEEAGVYGSIQPRSGTVERYVWLSNETLRLIKEECDGYYQGSDTDPLYVQPDEETSSSK
ncbi:hypothetical protein N7478_013088 [Penicillium angulare]|uniref:uncharacterized protein n=1 Tax=Penicillium angulare TaxID=116970 RepID=UPI002541ABE7|nr:uncharacterized protein N7478_013088 [Penicillium angulare]KAJ5256984.1 hypothetical protein N7478_013088 [Penicillium angulare]